MEYPYVEAIIVRRWIGIHRHDNPNSGGTSSLSTEDSLFWRCGAILVAKSIGFYLSCTDDEWENSYYLKAMRDMHTAAKGGSNNMEKLVNTFSLHVDLGQREVLPKNKIDEWVQWKWRV